jgi:hypothetical protein
VEIKLTMAIVLIIALVIKTIKVMTMNTTTEITAFGGAVTVEDRLVSNLQCCNFQ